MTNPASFGQNLTCLHEAGTEMHAANAEVEVCDLCGLCELPSYSDRAGLGPQRDRLTRRTERERIARTDRKLWDGRRLGRTLEAEAWNRERLVSTCPDGDAVSKSLSPRGRKIAPPRVHSSWLHSL